MMILLHLCSILSTIGQCCWCTFTSKTKNGVAASLIEVLTADIVPVSLYVRSQIMLPHLPSVMPWNLSKANPQCCPLTAQTTLGCQ